MSQSTITGQLPCACRSGYHTGAGAPSPQVEHDLPLLDDDRVGLDPQPLDREGAAGRDVELPLVPGALQDLALARVDEVAAAVRLHVRSDDALAERCLVVRADVAQRVVA